MMKYSQTFKVVKLSIRYNIFLSETINGIIPGSTKYDQFLYSNIK